METDGTASPHQHSIGLFVAIPVSTTPRGRCTVFVYGQEACLSELLRICKIARPSCAPEKKKEGTPRLRPAKWDCYAPQDIRARCLGIGLQNSKLPSLTRPTRSERSRGALIVNKNYCCTAVKKAIKIIPGTWYQPIYSSWIVVQRQRRYLVPCIYLGTSFARTREEGCTCGSAGLLLYSTVNVGFEASNSRGYSWWSHSSDVKLASVVIYQERCIPPNTNKPDRGPTLRHERLNPPQGTRRQASCSFSSGPSDLERRPQAAAGADKPPAARCQPRVFGRLQSTCRESTRFWH